MRYEFRWSPVWYEVCWAWALPWVGWVVQPPNILGGESGNGVEPPIFKSSHLNCTNQTTKNFQKVMSNSFTFPHQSSHIQLFGSGLFNSSASSFYYFIDILYGYDYKFNIDGDMYYCSSYCSSHLPYLNSWDKNALTLTYSRVEYTKLSRRRNPRFNRGSDGLTVVPMVPWHGAPHRGDFFGRANEAPFWLAIGWSSNYYYQIIYNARQFCGTSYLRVITRQAWNYNRPHAI